MKLFNSKKTIFFIALSITVLAVLSFLLYSYFFKDDLSADLNREDREEFQFLEVKLDEQEKEVLINWLKENSGIAVKEEITICRDKFYWPSPLYQDIAEAMEKGLNIKINYYHVPWYRIIPPLIEGQCDAIFELTVSEERRKNIDFTEPVYPGREQAIAVSKENNALLEMFNSIVNQLKIILR